MYEHLHWSHNPWPPCNHSPTYWLSSHFFSYQPLVATSLLSFSCWLFCSRHITWTDPHDRWCFQDFQGWSTAQHVQTFFCLHLWFCFVAGGQLSTYHKAKRVNCFHFWVILINTAVNFMYKFLCGILFFLTFLLLLLFEIGSHSSLGWPETNYVAHRLASNFPCFSLTYTGIIGMHYHAQP